MTDNRAKVDRNPDGTITVTPDMDAVNGFARRLGIALEAVWKDESNLEVLNGLCFFLTSAVEAILTTAPDQEFARTMSSALRRTLNNAFDKLDRRLQ